MDILQYRHTHINTNTHILYKMHTHYEHINFLNNPQNDEMIRVQEKLHKYD